MADQLDTDWYQYRRHILAELERIATAVQEVDNKIVRLHTEDISALKVEIAMLKVKAGMWGIGGGLIASLGALLLKVVQ